MTSWIDKKAEYEQFCRKIDSSVRLTTKDGWFWKALGRFLQIVTFGGVNYRKFLFNFATTIGPVQAYPSSWLSLSKRTLVHETRHTQQSRWFGLGSPWLGIPLMGFCYGLFPLFPVGFNLCRWLCEVDADKASYRWMLANGEKPAAVLARAARFGTTVCSGAYGWAWFEWAGGVEEFMIAAEKEIERSEK